MLGVCHHPRGGEGGTSLKYWRHQRAILTASVSQHQRLIHGENMANAYLQGVEISASQFLDIFHHYDNDGNLFPYFVDFMN